MTWLEITWLTASAVLYLVPCLRWDAVAFGGWGVLGMPISMFFTAYCYYEVLLPISSFLGL